MGDVKVGGASLRIVISEIPLLAYLESNLRPLSGVGTVLGGQFDWGGLLLKGNGECKGTLNAVGNRMKSVKV